MTAPSGRQLELTFGNQSAVVVEVGAGLRTYTVAGRDVVDGYPADEMAHGGRGQVLAPWPNRIEDGHYTFDDAEQQLPLSEVGHHNAIHGLVRWVAWTVVEEEPSRVVLEHLLHPQPGYPFLLALRLDYALDADGLTVSLTATNEGTTACPFGAGAHPYLTLADGLVDDLVLRSPARVVLTANERAIPVARQDVDGTAYDFREGRLVGDLVLDHAFTDLGHGPDGRAVVELSHPDSGRRVEPGWTAPTTTSWSSPATRSPRATADAGSPSSR